MESKESNNYTLKRWHWHYIWMTHILVTDTFWLLSEMWILEKESVFD